MKTIKKQAEEYADEYYDSDDLPYAIAYKGYLQGFKDATKWNSSDEKPEIKNAKTSMNILIKAQNIGLFGHRYSMIYAGYYDASRKFNNYYLEYCLDTGESIKIYISKIDGWMYLPEINIQ